VGGVRDSAEEVWQETILPTLCEYVRIPNVSAAYDAQWREHGHMMRAAELMRDWCLSRPVAGMTVELLTHESLSPLLIIEIDASGTDRDDTVLLYGHLDKQPEMTGWRAPYGPWEPVIDNGRLYGRGGADDGYAVYALTAAAWAFTGTPYTDWTADAEACQDFPGVKASGKLTTKYHLTVPVSEYFD